MSANASEFDTAAEAPPGGRSWRLPDGRAVDESEAARRRLSGELPDEAEVQYLPASGPAEPVTTAGRALPIHGSVVRLSALRRGPDELGRLHLAYDGSGRGLLTVLAPTPEALSRLVELRGSESGARAAMRELFAAELEAARPLTAHDDLLVPRELIDDEQGPGGPLLVLCEGEASPAPAPEATIDDFLTHALRLTGILEELHQAKARRRFRFPWSAADLLSVGGRTRLLVYGTSEDADVLRHELTDRFLDNRDRAAPELLRKGMGAEPADIWILGTLLHEWLSGSHPFAPIDDSLPLRVIEGAEVESIAEPRFEVPEALPPLVASCLARRVHGRPDAALLNKKLAKIAEELESARVERERRARARRRRGRIAAATALAVLVLLAALTPTVFIPAWRTMAFKRAETRLRTGRGPQRIAAARELIAAAQQDPTRRGRVRADLVAQLGTDDPALLQLLRDELAANPGANTAAVLEAFRDPARRPGAISVLRQIGASVLPPVRAMAADPDAALARAAALTYVNILRSSKDLPIEEVRAGTGFLLATFGGRDGTLRGIARTALVDFGRKDERVLGLLAPRLKGPQGETAAVLLAALGERGFGTLAAASRSREVLLRKRAFKGLERMSVTAKDPLAGKARTALVYGLRDANPAVRAEVKQSLLRLGKSVAAELVSALSDRVTAPLAEDLLETLGAACAAEVAGAINDPKRGVRARSLLASYAAADPRGMRALEAALDQKSSRAAALSVASRTGKVAVPVLGRRLLRAADSLKPGLVGAIAAIGSEASPLGPQLLNMLEGSSGDLRAELLKAMKTVPTPPKARAEAVMTCLDDPDNGIVELAFKRLAELEGQLDRVRLARDLLERAGERPALARAAGRFVVDAIGPPASPVLIEALGSGVPGSGAPGSGAPGSGAPGSGGARVDIARDWLIALLIRSPEVAAEVIAAIAKSKQPARLIVVLERSGRPALTALLAAPDELFSESRPRADRLAGVEAALGVRAAAEAYLEAMTTGPLSVRRRAVERAGELGPEAIKVVLRRLGTGPADVDEDRVKVLAALARRHGFARVSTAGRTLITRPKTRELMLAVYARAGESGQVGLAGLLTHREVEVRRAAEDRIVTLGGSAFALLHKTCSRPSPELRGRLVKLTERIVSTRREAGLAAVAAVDSSTTGQIFAQGLVASGEPGLSLIAERSGKLSGAAVAVLTPALESAPAERYRSLRSLLARALGSSVMTTRIAGLETVSKLAAAAEPELRVEALNYLLPFVEAKSEVERRVAQLAVARLAGAVPDGVRRLDTAADAAGSPVAERALLIVLAKLGAPAAEALERRIREAPPGSCAQVLAALESAPSELVLKLADALFARVAATPELEPAYGPLAERHGAALLRPAVEALARKDDRPRAKALLAKFPGAARGPLLNSLGAEPAVRDEVVTLLAADAKLSISELNTCLRKPDAVPGVLRVIERMGERGQTGFGLVVGYLNDKDPKIRKQAIRTIASILPKDPMAIGFLSRGLSDSDADVRLETVRVLLACPAHGRALLLSIRARPKDSDPEVAEAIAKLIARYSGES